MEKKENWCKRNTYIIQWIMLFSLIPILMGIWITIFSFREPNVIIVDTGCPIDDQIAFEDFLKDKCDELEMGHYSYLLSEDLSRFISGHKATLLGAQMHKNLIGSCTTNLRCIHSQEISDSIDISTQVQVCITKAATNETECFN